MAGGDGSAPSRVALEWAVTEARLRNIRVRVVAAREFPPVTVGMEGLVRDPDVSPQISCRFQNEALDRVDSEGVTVTGDVIQGSAAAVLLRAAENAGLLVVSGGLGGFTGMLLGPRVDAGGSSPALSCARGSNPVPDRRRGMRNPLTRRERPYGESSYRDP
ncbi:hypothetical protein ASG92_18455 [Arthrobacter sp. Soil736]|nr:hypothetical protein ASG92_18455 [Arthrobacter sp. Soil736]